MKYLKYLSEVAAFILSLHFILIFCGNCRKAVPNEKYCTKLFYHNVKVVAEDESLSHPLRNIMVKSLLEEYKPEAFISECIKSKNSDQIECELKAENFLMLKECTRKFKKSVSP